MAGDDSQDDGERTRIGGLPPPLPKAPAAPAPPAAAPPAAAPAAEDAGERTTIAPARPPGVPTAVPSSPAAPAAEDAGERTTIAPARPPGVPPAAPAAPAAAAPGAAPDTGDHTRVIATPPPGTARPAAPAAPQAAAPEAPQGDVTVDPARPRPAAAPDDGERTVVLAPRKVESTVSLERRAPKGTEETIRLDRPSLLLGRGHGCDVKLRTPTASREHAKIFFRNGQWMIAGVEGKSFYADGARQTGGEVALTGGMKLRLGDDEFEVVDTAGGAASRSGGGLWARISAFVRGLFGRRT